MRARARAQCSCLYRRGERALPAAPSYPSRFMRAQRAGKRAQLAGERARRAKMRADPRVCVQALLGRVRSHLFMDGHAPLNALADRERGPAPILSTTFLGRTQLAETIALCCELRAVRILGKRDE